MIDALAALYQAITEASKIMREPVQSSYEQLIAPSLGGKKKGVRESIGSYDITDYATNPKHESMVRAIYNSLSKRDLDPETAIRQVAPNSPLKGDMVHSAANRFGVDPRLILALMQADSSYGTKGKGARTLNPGNVGNMDNGSTKKFKDWQSGVDAVAEWLSKRRRY